MYSVLYLGPAKFIDHGVRTNQIHLLTEIHCFPESEKFEP